MVGGALVRRLAGEGVELLTVGRREVDLRDQAAVTAWFAGETPAGGVSGGRQGRRHRRQQHAARRIHLRQSDDRNQRDPRRASQRRREADVSRLVLHLSEARRPAVARGFDADRPPGADQRALCDRQDRRHQDGRGLSQPVRLRLHQRDADQSVRTGRQLSSRIQPRRRRTDPPVSRSQGRRRSRTWWCGAPARRGANSSMSTTWRTPACI